MRDAPLSTVQEWLAGRLSAPGRAWLDRALGEVASNQVAFFASFSSAARKLGDATLELSAEEASRAQASGQGWLVVGSSPDELARVLLLSRAAAATGGEPSVAFVGECFRTGDNREKRAVLRALALLPEPARFVEIGVNACRSSVQTVFEAICCENPYAAAHFAEASFNQMVLKALFTGVALARIDGLDRRLGPELARMAAGYASERRAAGRSVPADIGRLLSEGETR